MSSPSERAQPPGPPAATEQTRQGTTEKAALDVFRRVSERAGRSRAAATNVMPYPPPPSFYKLYDPAREEPPPGPPPPAVGQYTAFGATHTVEPGCPNLPSVCSQPVLRSLRPTVHTDAPNDVLPAMMNRPRRWRMCCTVRSCTRLTEVRERSQRPRNPKPSAPPSSRFAHSLAPCGLSRHTRGAQTAEQGSSHTFYRARGQHGASPEPVPAQG